MAEAARRRSSSDMRDSHYGSFLSDLAALLDASAAGRCELRAGAESFGGAMGDEEEGPAQTWHGLDQSARLAVMVSAGPTFCH